MDESEEASGKSLWWSPIMARLQQLNWPQRYQIYRLAKTSLAALRVVSWQERIRDWWTDWMATMERVRTNNKLAYYIIPSPLIHKQRGTISRHEVAPRLRIICNPASGTGHSSFAIRELEETAAWLGEHKLPAEVCETKGPGHASQLAREAVQKGMDMVVAAGGDGTISEVMQALVGQSTALGVLPMGTVNVWARETGIPLRLDQAREVLRYGVRRRIDVGRANDRYFLLMAGVGFDAEVARRVQDGAPTQMGLKMVDYFATTGWLAVTHRPARVTIRFDRGKRRTFNALMIIIGNTRLYGGVMTFAKHAVADDGVFDVVTMEGGSLGYRLSVLVRAFFRRAKLGPKARTVQCHTVHIESTPPLPVQVDGDVIGRLPMTFSIVPSSLSVIVPANTPGDIFHRPPLVK
ncbi:MAG: diacylglycerol/lipid kinase family protein [Ktedonobacterales bacterium]